MAHFRPLQDRILVRRIEAEEKTPGGIIIPDTAKEKPVEGEVLAVGPGARDETGTLRPLDVKVGDRVLFGKWAGTEVLINGEDRLILKESDILGVIEDDAQGGAKGACRGIERWLQRKLASAAPHARRCSAGSTLLRMRSRSPWDPKVAMSCSTNPLGRPGSARTGLRSPRRSSSPTGSRTWARRCSERLPLRQASSPATAPPRRRFWLRRSPMRVPRQWSPG